MNPTTTTTAAEKTSSKPVLSHCLIKFMIAAHGKQTRDTWIQKMFPKKKSQTHIKRRQRLTTFIDFDSDWTMGYHHIYGRTKNRLLQMIAENKRRDKNFNI